MPDETLTDPYFTPEQWQAVQEETQALLKVAHTLATVAASESADQTAVQAAAQEWLKEEKMLVPLCSCKAHESVDLYTSIINPLVAIEPPLTDDSGNLLATVLLPYLLKGANLHNLSLRSSRPGTCGSVQYVLRFPSGAEYLYSGWPDFQFSQKFSMAERKLGKQVGPEESVRAVGEVQSPPGYSTEAKSRAFSQAGIYTVGHFHNTTSVNKLATVVLYKDLTAHIAFATVCRTKGSVDVSGTVTYQLVHSVNPFNLQHEKDMALFASVFVATLKSTLS